MNAHGQDDMPVIDLGNTTPTAKDAPKEQQYDPEPKRDWVRASVTMMLTLSFMGLVAFACTASWSGKEHWEAAKEALQILLPAVGSLLGSAIGFYFVSRNRH